MEDYTFGVKVLQASISAKQDVDRLRLELVLQGEGGYVFAPNVFLEGLRAVCDQHRILLIVDKVQYGYGRAGKNDNIEYSGMRLDIFLSAKVRSRHVPECLRGRD